MKAVNRKQAPRLPNASNLVQPWHRVPLSWSGSA